MVNGFTVWFTGMMGSGKSTLAQALSNRLKRLGLTPELLDGGDLSQMLQVGNAQTKDERDAESKRLAWLCKLISRGGGIVLQSAVQSPYREARDEARRQIGRFVEVFVDCQIDQLIARDRSGTYKKALAGDIKNLPGISEPYEPPPHPEVLIDTGRQTLDEAVEHLIGQLTALRYLEPHQAGLRARPKLTAEPKIPLRPLPLDPPPKPILYKAPPKVAPVKVALAKGAPVKPGAEGRQDPRVSAKSEAAGDAKAQARPGLLKSVGPKAGGKVSANREASEERSSGKSGDKAGKPSAKPSKATGKPSLVVAKKPADRGADKAPVKLVSRPAPSKAPSKQAAPVRTPVKVAPKSKDKSAARVVLAEPKRAAGGRKR